MGNMEDENWGKGKANEPSFQSNAQNIQSGKDVYMVEMLIFLLNSP